MSNLGKKAAKKAGSKGLKAGRKILAKIIGYIGLPIIIGMICFIVIVGGLNSQISIIEKLKYHTTDEVVKALNRIEKRYKSSFYTVFKSITVDNGHEFMDCNAMEKALYRKGKRTEIYYCHPNSPGERGSNENCNLLVRRFLHKGMDFDKHLTTSKAKEVQEWINTYPRGIHSGKSSKELFINELINLGIAHYYRC